MRKPIPTELVQTILKSGIKAFEKYYGMTEEGCWVFYTPEYWYTTNIAMDLRKSFRTPFSIFLEESVTDFRSGAVRGQSGRPSKGYRSNGRADITLWETREDNWEAKSLVEIKKAWSWGKDTLGKDLDRLCAILLETGKKLRSGSVDCTFLTVITDASGENRSIAKQKITKLNENLDDKINSYIKSKNSKLTSESFIKFSSYYAEDESIAAVIVFKISVDMRLRS